MSDDTLRDLIAREELSYVQQYVYQNEGPARRVYSAMLADYVPVPLKCAVVLMRSITFEWWAVVLFIGRSFRITEMPKPINERFSWDELMDKLGLPRQDEWNTWKADSFPGFSRAFGDAVVVDYFVTPGLKGAGYKCRACGETFETYDKLFDGHVFSNYGHDKEFNAVVLAELFQEALAEAETSAAALDAARKIVPTNATIIEERTTEPTTKRHQPSGTSQESEELAFADARRWVTEGAKIVDERVTQQGASGEIEIELECPHGEPDRSSVLKRIDNHLWLHRPDINGVSGQKYKIADYVCTQQPSRGFLGIGKKDGKFKAQLVLPWEVVIEYETEHPATARIRYRVKSEK